MSRRLRHSKFGNRLALLCQALLTVACLVIVWVRVKRNLAGLDAERDDDEEEKFIVAAPGSAGMMAFLRECFGYMLFVPSFAVWFWSRWILAEKSSFSIAAVAPPKLCVDGPFAFTCHPVYISGFAFMFAFALITGSKRGVACLLVALPIQVWRARQESSVLAKKFGFKYTKYLEDIIAVNYRRKRMWWFFLWIFMIVWIPSVVYGKRDKRIGAQEDLKKWSRNAAIAEETYNRLIPCLSFQREYSISYPKDASEHHQFLLNLTSQFRGLPPHQGQGFYREKWIENYFIDAFLNRPLESFSGLFPLFVQWSDLDYMQHSRDTSMSSRKRNEIYHELVRALRPDVMYVTVSQANKGLEAVKVRHPNVLVLSAGGEGNVPIPLIKGKIARQSPPLLTPSSFTFDVSFMGNIGHDYTRVKTMSILRDVVREFNDNALTSNSSTTATRSTTTTATAGKSDRNSTTATYAQSESKPPQPQAQIRFSVQAATENNTLWQQVMSNTIFNLAPRGYGRASFRLAEIVQIGRIPVYVYNDVPWIPYAGTPAGCDTLGFVVRDSFYDLHAFVEKVGALLNMENDRNKNQINSMLDAVERHRSEYTYKGVLRQIELFFKDPLDSSGLGVDGGGYLRCAHTPHEELVAPLDNLLPRS